MSASLTHAQRVLRLYRHALQHTRHWVVYRDGFRAEAAALRARFEAHKDERNVITASNLLAKGEVRFLFV